MTALERSAGRGQAEQALISSDPARRPGPADPAVVAVLDDFDAGRRRAAWPDPTAPHGWRVDPDAKAAILRCFADRAVATWDLDGAFRFRDRVGLPPKDLLRGDWRVVPGGTSVRAGAHLEPGVTIMPPSFVNIGAWVGADSMIDSHVLVGSCAQIGARVHLAAGVQVGGVLEPPGARPVIVEDEAFVGAQVGLFEGVLVRRRAVLAAGLILTGTSRLFDLVRDEVRIGSPEAPLVVPEGAVVVPGSRKVAGSFAEQHELSIATALIVKYRDAATDARVALEAILR